MRGLISSILQLTLLAIFTFAFVVLFEHGPREVCRGSEDRVEFLAFLCWIRACQGAKTAAHTRGSNATVKSRCWNISDQENAS